VVVGQERGAGSGALLGTRTPEETEFDQFSSRLLICCPLNLVGLFFVFQEFNRINLLVIADGLDGGIAGDESRLGLLDGLVQVPQMTPFWLPEQTCVSHQQHFSIECLNATIDCH
jgi:hypothetical protein